MDDQQLQLEEGSPGAEGADDIERAADDSEPRRYCFWVAGYPGLQTSLYVFPRSEPADAATEAEAYRTANLTFFDCDGNAVSDAQVGFRSNSIGVFELGHFLEGLKLQGGFKHGMMRVEMDKGVQSLCRIHSNRSATVLGEPLVVTAEASKFFPVCFSQDRRNMLCLVNRSGEDGEIRCRLFLGKRSPDVDVFVPANGSRIIGLEAEFPEHTEVSVGGMVKAYMRLSTRSDGEFGVQLLDSVEGDKSNRIFTSVS